MIVLCGVFYWNAAEVHAEEKTVTINPNMVNDIQNDATKLLVYSPSTDDQNYKYVFKFKLSQTSDVRITGLSRYAFWFWGGTTKYTLTNALDEFNASYNKSWETQVYADHSWSDKAGNMCDEFVTLPKGTYYLMVETALADNFRTDTCDGMTIYNYDLGHWLSVNASAYTKQVEIKTCKNVKGKKISLKYKKVEANGYEIQYSTSSKFKKKTVIKTTAGSKTIKSLKKGKTYYVRVRAYRYDSDNKKVYGKWSDVKKVKIKK